MGGIVAGLLAASGLVLALSRTVAPPAPTVQATSGVQVAHVAQLPTAVSPSAPAVSVSAPAVSASAAAPIVRVSVVAYPKHAQLLLDGRRVGNPFAQELAAGTGSHRLEASADGYQSSSQLVSLERDVELVVELRKSTLSRRTRGALARPAPTHVPQRADAAPRHLATQPSRSSDPSPLPGQDLGGPSRIPRAIDEKDLYQ